MSKNEIDPISPFNWEKILYYLNTGRALEDHADIALRVMVNELRAGNDLDDHFKEYLLSSFEKYLKYKNITLDQAFGLIRKKAGKPKLLPASIVGLPSHVYKIWYYLIKERTNMDGAVAAVSKETGFSKTKLNEHFKFYRFDLAETIKLEKLFQKKPFTSKELEVAKKYISKTIFAEYY